MTLVLADRDGVQRVATYGFSDLDAKASVKPEQLFHIGSISKSFVANCILQLHQEGKLDLNKPVVEYLPWFQVDSSFAPITTHHLLTHSAGLPGDQPVFSMPMSKFHAAYEPGAHFHYSNTAFETLGHLLWTLDQRPIDEIFRKRVFEPLGMTKIEPLITLDIRDKFPKSYMAYQNDRTYPLHARLAEAPGIIMTDAAGCIASPPHDMGLYIQMIANHGKGPRKALLTEESFGLFSKPHIKADEFGPTASYGYGIAVDTLDGHAIVRHTGGMVSFASAIHVDIDEGVGAFASINAMQGYRPNPVAQYAIQLMRAQREKKASPGAPEVNGRTTIKNGADYVGTYKSDAGRTFEIATSGDKLMLVNGVRRTAMEMTGGDMFVVDDPDYQRFSLAFSRADAKDDKSAVVEAGWGGEWFTNAKYSGPRTFEHKPEFDQYVGHYRNESPWVGSMRIVVRKGKLMIDGVIPLEPAADGWFLLRDDDFSPERIQFGQLVNGKAMQLQFSGMDLWRVMTA
jgi:CubicO group peptidase (beta-lactamase class C family)